FCSNTRKSQSLLNQRILSDREVQGMEVPGSIQSQSLLNQRILSDPTQCRRGMIILAGEVSIASQSANPFRRTHPHQPMARRSLSQSLLNQRILSDRFLAPPKPKGYRVSIAS